jgi:hypothetical protein
METYRKVGETVSVLVGEGSQLAKALAAPAKVAASLARDVYDETTKRFVALYGAEDAEWFMNWSPSHVKEQPWPSNT